MKTFKVYFYFILNKNEEYNLYIESGFLDVNNQYVYDLIRYIIKKINNESITINNNSKRYIISLKESENEDNNFYINNFEVRKCMKKTLKPNKELPPYESNLLLNKIKEDSISLICKNKLNIMLFEKYNDIEEEKYDDNLVENHKENVNKENLNERNNKYNCKYNFKYKKYVNYKCLNCLII